MAIASHAWQHPYLYSVTAYTNCSKPASREPQKERDLSIVRALCLRYIRWYNTTLQAHGGMVVQWNDDSCAECENLPQRKGDERFVDLFPFRCTKSRVKTHSSRLIVHCLFQDRPPLLRCRYSHIVCSTSKLKGFLPHFLGLSEWFWLL